MPWDATSVERYFSDIVRIYRDEAKSSTPSEPVETQTPDSVSLHEREHDHVDRDRRHPGFIDIRTPPFPDGTAEQSTTDTKRHAVVGKAESSLRSLDGITELGESGGEKHAVDYKSLTQSLARVTIDSGVNDDGPSHTQVRVYTTTSATQYTILNTPQTFAYHELIRQDSSETGTTVWCRVGWVHPATGEISVGFVRLMDVDVYRNESTGEIRVAKRTYTRWTFHM
jgi:hypothetical protein